VAEVSLLSLMDLEGGLNQALSGPCRPSVALVKLAVTGSRAVVVGADGTIACHRWLASSASTSDASQLRLEPDPTPPR
jgi:hypothetical protein